MRIQKHAVLDNNTAFVKNLSAFAQEVHHRDRERMQWVHDPGRSGWYPEVTSFGSVVVALLQFHSGFAVVDTDHHPIAN